MPPPTLIDGLPPTALAPMQDVTDLAFMRIVGAYGAPDWFFTEYFRVHESSRPEAHILDSIRHHGTGRPVIAQLIGENCEHLARTVRLLETEPIAGIDLNMGCPAPKVYRKNVGGGLLRDPERIDIVLGTLRAACQGPFSVKMRVGFDNWDRFSQILELINKHRVDLLTVHGRTVKEMYRGGVHYDLIAHAKRSVACPVLANGNITSARRAQAVLAETGCDGVMIGRSAIRNPWIFRQCREQMSGAPVFQPTLGDVRDYLDRLWRENAKPDIPALSLISRMKKFVNFIGQSVDAEGQFVHAMRRATSEGDFFQLADRFLVDQGRDQLPFADEPYPGVIARPNQEGDETSC